MSEIKLQRNLSLFDVTNLVIGGIIGADVYVASSFGAGLLGPLSILVWVIAGLIAIVIALSFAQCASLLPRVGGPYAYAREAWGPFPGFLAGWSLWLAEWISLAVFPVAFTRYLMFFFPNLDWVGQTFVKVLFVAFLATTNIVGVKTAGRTNDVLTIIKIVPLIFFSGIGIIFVILNPAVVASNFSQFAPFGLTNFGSAVILIFWAYAGFEISTIPADVIDDPDRTIPRAITVGISIVTVFYLTTNVILFAVRPWAQLASDSAPLASATSLVLAIHPALALVGALIVGGGALISVSGSDESGMIGASRLGYALALDGLFPRAFAKTHPRFKTPYLGIMIQAVTALIASIVGTVRALIATSVFFMAFAYLLTVASVFKLRKRDLKPKFRLKGGLIIPISAFIFSLYLLSQVTITQLAIGLGLLLVGIPIYTRFSPKKELKELKRILVSTPNRLRRAYRQEQRFLGNIFRLIKRYYRRKTGRKQAWAEVEER